MRHRFAVLLPVIVAGLCLAPSAAMARIKLITLPVRQRVEIQLDNPGATLVEEERIVPLVQGTNQVDFAWANTQIDKDTILFRVLPQPDAGAPASAKPLDVKVLSVSYPPGENALVWQVASSGSGSARVRISYLLGNLTKHFNYRAVASHDEKTLALRQYIRLQNLANEEYGSTGIWAGFGPRFLKPVGINETIEMLVEKYEDVPITKTYTCNPAEFGYLDQPKNKLLVPMHYVLTNNKENRLGTAPLQFGKVRIFQDDGRGTTAFLGEDWGKYTPLDDRMRLYVGTAQDVVVVRTIETRQLHRVAGNLYDVEVVLKYEIENCKDSAVTLDVAENLRRVREEVFHNAQRDPQWELGKLTTLGQPDAELSTVDKKVFHAALPARGADGKAKKIVHKLHFFLKNEW